jgi:hypothetical protein
MLLWRLPQCGAFRVPLPQGLPDVESDLVRMLRVPEDEPCQAALSALADPAEREALFFSLATTLTRATYHRNRFEDIVRILAERRLEVGGTVSSDTCAKYAIFEAAAMVTAARTAVDEILYIAARRSGASPTDAGGWKVDVAITCNLSKDAHYHVPEVVALRGHLGWYEELNKYRNVLVHRGWRPQFGGFFPIGSTLPEASDPSRNLMLTPNASGAFSRTSSNFRDIR